MMETNNDDEKRMRDFFYSLGVSSNTSNNASKKLLADFDVGSQIKLARKISWQSFNLQDIGFDELDSEAIVETLRSDFPDVFADKKSIGSSSLKIESKAATVKSEIKAKPRSKSTGSRELSSLLLYSPEEVVDTAEESNTASKVNLSHVITNPRQTIAVPLAATTRSGLVSVSDNSNRNSTTNDNNRSSNNGSDTRIRSDSNSSIDNESDNDDKRNNKYGGIDKSRNTRRSSDGNKVLSNEKSKNNDHNKSGNGKSLKLLTSSKSEEFSSKLPKNVLQIISGLCKVKKADFTCSGLNYDAPKDSSSKAGEHPIVGCRDYPVSKGKWYYEATVTNGAHVGWADSRFLCDKDGVEFRGVGEDEHSWAHDGSAILHGKKALFHKNRDDLLSHENGSLIGCAVNLDLFQLTFYLMREDDSTTNIKFKKIQFHDSLYPCVSFDDEEAVRFNFGSTPFAMKVPKDFLPYADNIEALGGDAGDKANRLKMRASDGFRPGASSIGDKPHHVEGNMAKEAQKEDLLDLAQNQWIALELKMKQQKFTMLSAENCKDKDLSYNKRKVTILYYFKEDQLGWLQGKIHAKTQGPEAQDFNWICDFSKPFERKPFRLDDDLYITNKDLLEGKGAYEAEDRSWCVFEKISSKRKRKKLDWESSKKRPTSKALIGDRTEVNNDCTGSYDDTDDKGGSGHDDDDDDSDGICSVDEEVFKGAKDEHVEVKPNCEIKDTGMSDINLIQLSNVKDDILSDKEGKGSLVEESLMSETNESVMGEESGINNVTNSPTSSSVNIIPSINKYSTVGMIPCDHENKIKSSMENEIMNFANESKVEPLLKGNVKEQDNHVVDRNEDFEKVVANNDYNKDLANNDNVDSSDNCSNENINKENNTIILMEDDDSIMDIDNRNRTIDDNSENSSERGCDSVKGSEISEDNESLGSKNKPQSTINVLVNEIDDLNQKDDTVVPKPGTLENLRSSDGDNDVIFDNNVITEEQNTVVKNDNDDFNKMNEDNDIHNHDDGNDKMNVYDKIAEENDDYNTITDDTNTTDNNKITDKDDQIIDNSDQNRDTDKKDNDNCDGSNNDVINSNAMIERCDINSSVSIDAPQTWYYQDPQKNIHGPYEATMMKQWFERNYLSIDLPIKLNHWLGFHPLGLVFTGKKPFMPSVFISEPPPIGI